MLGSCRTALWAVVLSAVAVAAAQAATITRSDAPGTLAAERPDFMRFAYQMDLSTHTRCGNSGALQTNVGSFSKGGGLNGGGHSVCGDTSSLQVKDQADPVPFGRHNPPTRQGPWVDSNDLPHVRWEIDTKALGIAKITGLEFALVDAHDQLQSFFDLAVSGTSASFHITEREADGTVHWLTILFPKPVAYALIEMETRRNDGYGVANVTVAPIPVPPAVLLLATGVALLGAARHRRRTRAA